MIRQIMNVSDFYAPVCTLYVVSVTSITKHKTHSGNMMVCTIFSSCILVFFQKKNQKSVSIF